MCKSDSTVGAASVNCDGPGPSCCDDGGDDSPSVLVMTC